MVASPSVTAQRRGKKQKTSSIAPSLSWSCLWAASPAWNDRDGEVKNHILKMWSKSLSPILDSNRAQNPMITLIPRKLHKNASKDTSTQTSNIWMWLFWWVRKAVEAGVPSSCSLSALGWTSKAWNPGAHQLTMSFGVANSQDPTTTYFRLDIHKPLGCRWVLEPPCYPDAAFPSPASATGEPSLSSPTKRLKMGQPPQSALCKVGLSTSRFLVGWNARRVVFNGFCDFDVFGKNLNRTIKNC